MMEPMTHELSGVSETSMCLMNSEEEQHAFLRMPVLFTVTVGAVDYLLVHAEAQVEDLRQYRTNLGLVRAELAGMETFIRTVLAVGTAV